jgi:hypothetical protein
MRIQYEQVKTANFSISAGLGGNWPENANMYFGIMDKLKNQDMARKM